MIVNGKEYNLEDLVKQVDFNKNSFSKISSGLMLTNSEIDILTRNSINFQNARTLKDLILIIENILDEEEIDEDDADDLEYVLREISERDYYENSKKAS